MAKSCMDKTTIADALARLATYNVKFQNTPLTNMPAL